MGSLEGRAVARSQTEHGAHVKACPQVKRRRWYHAPRRCTQERSTQKVHEPGPPAARFGLECSPIGPMLFVMESKLPVSALIGH
jgi:hypothetical protein